MSARNPLSAVNECSSAPACPVCKAEQTKRLYVVTAEQSAQHFVLREADAIRHSRLASHIEKLWRGANCGVWRCSICQFGFSHPYIAGDATFYNLAYKRSTYPSDKWEYRRTIRALAESKLPYRRVLEVGAGFGLFLDKIADRLVPRSGITALEYDNASIAILRAKGYCAADEGILSAKVHPGFDAIFLFQVVEHMDNLDVLFSRLRDLVAPGGRIFIAVPNGRHIDFQESSGSLLDMPPNHIGRWSHTAFEIIVAAAGLQLRAIEIEPFSLASFIREDIAFSYMRRAQNSGTVWNWSLAKHGRGRSKFLAAIHAAAAAPLRAPMWLRSKMSGNGGGSMWVELERN